MPLICTYGVLDGSILSTSAGEKIGVSDACGLMRISSKPELNNPAVITPRITRPITEVPLERHPTKASAWRSGKKLRPVAAHHKGIAQGVFRRMCYSPGKACGMHAADCAALQSAPAASTYALIADTYEVGKRLLCPVLATVTGSLSSLARSAALPRPTASPGRRS